KRDGSRVRENFLEAKDAQLRQIELEGEFLARQQSDSTLRATRLTDTQVHIAEVALSKLEDDADLLRAVDYWLKHGKHHHVVESPRLDEAVEKFKKWLDGEGDGTGNGHCTLREHSRAGLGRRVEVFGNSIRNLRVNEITPDTIEDFLNKLRTRE